MTIDRSTGASVLARSAVRELALYAPDAVPCEIDVS